MILPDELEKKLIKEICDYEEEIKMPYVTSAERFGIVRIAMTNPLFILQI